MSAFATVLLRASALAAAALVVIGLVAYRVRGRPRPHRRLISPRHPVFRGRPCGRPWWLRNPAQEMPKRFIRRVIRKLEPEDLGVIFDGIVERNFAEAARADAHYDRIAEEVVPDTAKPRKPKPGKEKER
jgi:hypothetical protein